MTDYILEHDKGVIIATYSKGGKLKRLDAKKGFICDAKGYVFAQEEKDIELEFWKPYRTQLKELEKQHKQAKAEYQRLETKSKL